MTARKVWAENPVLTFVLIVGLSFLNVWPDLVGHGSAFLASATLVQHVTNGRVFFSLGLGIAAGSYALLPKWLATHDDAALCATAVTSLLSTAGYALCAAFGMPSAVAAILAFMVGMGYGALLVRFMCQLAQSGGMPTVLLICTASLILKTALDLWLGLLDDTAQLIATATTPIICTLAIFASQRVPERSGVPLDLSALPKCDPTNNRVLMSMLLMIAALHAITRSMSVLGFWGQGYLIAGNIGWADLAAYAVFAVAAYFTMSDDSNPDMLTRFLVPILGLMAGFLLLDKSISTIIGLPDKAQEIIATMVELYAHALYWMIHVTAIRCLPTHPYRLTGIAAALMSIVSVFMALLFQQIGDITTPLQMNSTVVMVAIYAFSVFVAVLLRGMQGGKDEKTADSHRNTEDMLLRLAEEHDLSPRETDVFMLLAHGRDRSFIRGELFISDATVKTHIQRIYAKFAVHSKQELISAVEEHTRAN